MKAPVTLLLVAATACTSGSLRQIDTIEPKVVVPQATPTGGEAYVGLPFPQFIFGPPVQNPAITTSTRAAQAVIQPHDRLKITPLASTPFTVALGFQEHAGKGDTWGEIMIPQERRVFAKFASDRSLGDWLIVLTDVNVDPGPDPVPLTAYRWDRASVERYAECGIEPFRIPYKLNHCTQEFYHSAKYILLIIHGNDIAGQ